ncbi:transcriptional regulator, AraC family [Bacteroides luti]|uniref:Transcriptional regulator, AraC family n=1 Tax=Bacteroides luti TaxID=1297750 RepID=A0A1M4TEA1_9BACE|nr:helix-turn-helix domain-containing protein [Bacteroides luti]SHE42771.1 transcriptional regulator, AraC family [Bacteroides luti]
MEQFENTEVLRQDLTTLGKFPDADYIENDFAIFNGINDVPIFDYPTRIDLSVMVIALSGYARVGINLKDYDLKKNDMIIVTYDQIVQLHEKSDDFTGLFFVLSRSFTEEIAVALERIVPIYLFIKDHPCTVLSDEEVASVMEYHSFLWEKVKNKNNTYRKEITKNILRALIFEMYSIFESHLPTKRFKSRKEELFESFLMSVSSNFIKERSVTFYADQLFLTPKHLSRVIKEVSGRSAGEWIDEQVILEAKARLKTLSLTVQEISDQLGFPNQSFFGKYFKRHVGMSPSDYRKK